MRLGIISDTHGTVPPGVFEVFAEVDHILHAGDVGSLDVLVELEVLAPVTAVYGNTDGFDVRRRCAQVAEIELEGTPVVVTHGDQFGMPTPALLCERFPAAEIIVYGHTHAPVLEQPDFTRTVINPGAVLHPRHGHLASVGIMELEAGLPPRARIVPLP